MYFKLPGLLCGLWYVPAKYILIFELLVSTIVKLLLHKMGPKIISAEPLTVILRLCMQNIIGSIKKD